MRLVILLSIMGWASCAPFLPSYSGRQIIRSNYNPFTNSPPSFPVATYQAGFGLPVNDRGLQQSRGIYIQPQQTYSGYQPDYMFRTVQAQRPLLPVQSQKRPISVLSQQPVQPVQTRPVQLSSYQPYQNQDQQVFEVNAQVPARPLVPDTKSVEEPQPATVHGIRPFGRTFQASYPTGQSRGGGYTKAPQGYFTTDSYKFGKPGEIEGSGHRVESVSIENQGRVEKSVLKGDRADLSERKFKASGYHVKLSSGKEYLVPVPYVDEEIFRPYQGPIGQEYTYRFGGDDQEPNVYVGPAKSLGRYTAIQPASQPRAYSQPSRSYA